MTTGEARNQLYEQSRSQFPVFDKALAHMAFMENAGGSQVKALHTSLVAQGWLSAFANFAVVVYRSQPALQMLCGTTCCSTTLN